MSQTSKRSSQALNPLPPPPKPLSNNTQSKYQSRKGLEILPWRRREEEERKERHLIKDPEVSKQEARPSRGARSYYSCILEPSLLVRAGIRWTGYPPDRTSSPQRLRSASAQNSAGCPERSLGRAHGQFAHAQHSQEIAARVRNRLTVAGLHRLLGLHSSSA